MKRNLLFDNRYFGWLFLLTGLIIQTVTYIISGDALLSYASGMCGVFSVVLCSQRKMSQYVFGYAQIITYVILAVRQNLWGEVAINVFYFITMFFGVVSWLKHYDGNGNAVECRCLSEKGWLTWLSVMTIGTLGLWYILLQTNDTQPFMDSITTIPAFIAQILLITRYREQWLFWLIINIGSIFMWYRAQDWCMVAQYIFWTFNCLYGFSKWK